MSGRSGRIDRRWLPLNALRAFEMVGRHLSFTGAAQSMHVSQSALSRHVAMLEDLLGQPLLSRRPHGLALTEAGAALLPAIGKSFDRLEQVLNDIVRRDGRQRRLRVHMAPSFLHQVALPILAEFRRDFPDVVIDLSSALAAGLPATEVDVAVVYDRPQAGADHLDHHGSLRAFEAGRRREIDLAHAASGDEAKEDVTSERAGKRFAAEPRTLGGRLLRDVLGAVRRSCLS